MYRISDRIQELYGDSEYSLYLKLLLDALCQYEKELLGNGRSFDEFNGNERRFVGNLLPTVKELLKKLGESSKDLDAELDFGKNAEEYVLYYCHCNDIEVRKRFLEILKNDENSNGEFSPDLIIHSPGNMKKQILYLEAKFHKNAEWYKDFGKITRFKKACHYLKEYVDDEYNPEFTFHVFLFLAGSLKEKISKARHRTNEEILKADPDLICIDKEKDIWICRTLKEVLVELGIN